MPTEMLDDDELAAKFFDNAAHDGWPRARAERLRTYPETPFGQRDLKELANFRG